MPCSLPDTTPRTHRFMARTRSPTSSASSTTSTLSSPPASPGPPEAPSNTLSESPSPTNSFSTSGDTIVAPRPVKINLLDLIHANYGRSHEDRDGAQIVFNIEVVDGAPIELVVTPRAAMEMIHEPPQNARVVVNITARGGGSVAFLYEGPERNGRGDSGRE